jgi:hypothetical protein
MSVRSESSRPASIASVAVLALCVAMGISANVSAELVYGITNTAQLVSWDSTSPGTQLNGVSLSGLQSNETIQGIDFRPATGVMYALGSSSRLYTLNTATGAATQVGAQFATSLNGSNFGFDFNPMIDRIRVVSNQNQNLVLNPDTGAVQAVGTPVFFGPADPNFGVDPNVVHSAYTNNFVGAPSTQLYGIDAGLDVMVTQANSAGTLGTVGPLGVNLDINEFGGFDISGSTGTAYVAGMPVGGSVSIFYTVNLATGAMTSLGQIFDGTHITAMTVAPVPAPGVLAVLALGVVGMPRRRRES